MSPRLTYLRLSSAIALAAVLAAGPARGASGKDSPSLLLFPVRSHWLSEPLAEAVTASLSNRLTDAGYGVAEMHRDSPALQLAVSEDWVSADILKRGNLEAAREPLAVAIGAGASIAGEVVEREAEVGLSLLVAATVSEKETHLEIGVPRTGNRKADAAELASGVVAALTPELWSSVAADPEGAARSAQARHAAGQAAMAEGMYREALLDFDAALIGAPGNADYLSAAAEARAALGDYSGAMVRMRTLAAIRPSDAEVALRLGYAALRAGEAVRAESAFLAAAEELRNDPRVVEGLALSARAQGETGRAEEYYQVLVSILPALSGAPSALPWLLANAEETVVLTGASPDQLPRQLGRLYLAGGHAAEGVAVLLAYHLEGDQPPYEDEEYMRLCARIDGEAETVARAAQGVFAAQALGQFSDEQAASQMDYLHNRSEAMASLAEQMSTSSLLEPAHRYRVLAYNFLNQSNFESLMHLRTREAERQRRADLLRTAFRKSLAQARSLAVDLLGAEPED